MSLKLVLSIFFILALGYNLYKFVQLLLKMKKDILLPATLEESQSLRKIPEKVVVLPTYSNHKSGIIVYFLLLLFIVVMYILGIITDGIIWSYDLVLIFSLTHTYHLLNMVAIVDEGLLYGSRFIPWKEIKSFEFVPIDLNHKFYGYSKEINNNGYELIIKKRFFSVSCILTSEEMKGKMTEILNKHLSLSRNEN
jgi:hypothetical protein